MVVPPSRSAVLARPRLHRRLRASVGSRATVVVAPAGWGKSTLLAAWAHDPEERRPVAWVSLDGDDNEPVRFWTYALSALAAVAPEASAEALAALSGQGLDPVDVALPALLNAWSRVEQPHVLVLDDYHVLVDQRIHETVEFVLAYLPPALHLVLAARFDPPLPLARMRARDELTEIRAGDLACTPEEAAALVGAVRPVRPETARRLVARTEGWPAGLHLAALALRDVDDPDAAAPTLKGDHRHVLDYLSTEVLPALDPAAQRLLVGCSPLETLSGPLCDAVLDTNGSAAVLDQLDHAELFVTALDPEHRWYRCHQLVRDVLGRHLDTSHPGERARLLGRAADWHLEHDQIDEAVRQCIAAGDPDRAVTLLRTHDRWFLDHGAMPTMLQLGEHLARQCVGDVVLCLWLAMAAGLCSQPDTSRRWLDAAEPLIEQEPQRIWRGSVRASADAIRVSYCLTGDVDAALRYARRAVEHENDPTLWGWVGARMALGTALYGAGLVREQVTVLDEARQAATFSELPALLTVQTAGKLAVGLVEIGELDRARRLLTTSEDTATAIERDWGAGAAAATSELRLAAARVVVIDRGPRNGLEAVRRAVELAEGYGRATVIVAALTDLAATTWALDDRSTARDALARAREIAAEEPLDAPVADALAALADRIGRRVVTEARARGALVERLTDRELAILRALRGPLSAREIGAELHLSINTIKGYTKSLYRKLDVSTRADAVARSQDLGLL